MPGIVARRVAIVSPFPPVASGIANYSFRLVEELAALGDLDIDCFADGLEFSPEPPRAPSGLDVYDARLFLGVEAATGGYDEVVYVLGNSEFHAAALAALYRRHGTVLAHDVRLSGLYRFAAGSAPAAPGSATSPLRRIYGPLVPDELDPPSDGAATAGERPDLLMAREVIGLADRFLVTSEASARLAVRRSRTRTRSTRRSRRVRDRSPPDKRQFTRHAGRPTGCQSPCQLWDRRSDQAT